eukprot:3329581-Pleurochrysis_carterae.AAC.1
MSARHYACAAARLNACMIALLHACTPACVACVRALHAWHAWHGLHCSAAAFVCALVAGCMHSHLHVAA